MSLLLNFLDQMPSHPQKVDRLVIGLHWTMVCGLKCGLASTMAGEHISHHQPVKNVGTMQDLSLQTLAEWVLSDNLLEAGIGMAALNAVLPIPDRNAREMNASQIILQNCPGKNVAVIGNFPFVEKIRDHAENCWVIDKKEFMNSLPATTAPEVLPRADIVAISATALINHSMENLLSLCKPRSLKIILGPSTPMSDLWFEHDIFAYSGTEIQNPQAVMLCVQQAAIFKQIKGVRLLSFLKTDSIPEQ